MGPNKASAMRNFSERSWNILTAVPDPRFTHCDMCIAVQEGSCESVTTVAPETTPSTTVMVVVMVMGMVMGMMVVVMMMVMVSQQLTSH